MIKNSAPVTGNENLRCRRWLTGCPASAALTDNTTIRS